MGWQSKIEGGIKNAGEYAGKFLLNGAHAQQAIPAQHRLLAAGGMFLGWMALDKVRDIVFGVNQLSEGEFVEVKREEVPAPLRFLHKTIDWNPHSDAPDQQWKKLAHQMLPAVGAGVGTVLGSMSAFELNGRAQNYAALKASKGPLTLMDAEMMTQYSHSKPLRVATAAFGGFSAASMMPVIYGSLLNLAFASANGARIFAGKLKMGNAAPAKALESQLGNVGTYVKDALHNDGHISDAWAKSFVDKVLTPMFGKDLETPQAQAEVRTKIHDIIQGSFDNRKGANVKPDEFAAAVAADMKKIFGNNKDGKGFDASLERLGLDKDKAVLGNGIPIVRKFHEGLAKAGLAEPASTYAARVQSSKSHGHGMSPAGVA